jgi:GNAT superfamily N-acetyltransferase
MAEAVTIRAVRKDEYDALGRLMVEVYSSLEGFPGPAEQPRYYDMLARIGRLSENDHTEVLVALAPDDEIWGGVVYFSDMSAYGSGGTATSERNASGFRLLGVSPRARGAGVGKALSLACIEKARHDGNRQVIIHTTEAMKVAWGMYRKLGFRSSPDLDFMQEALPVFGFRLKLE